MTNQEQYDKMIIPDELYTVDHDRALINAAKMIRENCIKKQVCETCAFYAHRKPPFECVISDGSMFTPHEWEV